MAARSHVGEITRVLEEQPELGERLDEGEQAQARAVLRARALVWPDEQPGAIPPEVLAPGAFGLLVLDGWLGLRVESVGAQRMEIVGPGDLLRPWSMIDDVVMAPARMGWRVVAPARMAILDRTFAEAAARWPEIAEALMDRLVLRSRRLTLQMTAEAQRRAEDRVLLVLWQLADRWGNVTPDGIEIQVPLTHRMLADLTGTRRPPVTAAIGRLRRRDLLATSAGGRFVLTGTPPRDEHDLPSP